MLRRLAALAEAGRRRGAGCGGRRRAGRDAQLRPGGGGPGTKFVFAYPGIGLTPDCGVSYLLPRAIGSHRALRFALGGQPISRGRRAQEWGLVTEVAEDAPARARELVTGLAGAAAGALGDVRRLLRAGWELDREATGAEEARTISSRVSGAEAQALIARFVGR